MSSFRRSLPTVILTFALTFFVATLLFQQDASAKNVPISKAQSRITGSFNNALKAFGNSDYARAYYWFNLLAEAGHAKAQSNLGLLFLRGRGAAQDTDIALRWFEKAAEQGHPTARYRLAMHYERGVGLKVNYVDALRWALLGLQVTKSDSLRVKLRDFKDELLDRMPQSQIRKAVHLVKNTTGA